jgi:Flp pilus assembly protein TadD
MRPNSRAIPLLRTSAIALALLALAACRTTSDDDVTGSIGGASGPRTETEWRRAIEVYGTRYQENRNDAENALRYAEALRQTTQRAQAVAVLEQASIANPHYKPLLGAYGRALAEVGRYEQALEVLSRAHTPDQPDWRILNVQGAVFDQLGRHDEARRHYASALKIKPDESSILSNLGLSYALVNDLKRAEDYLRQASRQPGAAPKARQNLALVIGLQGRLAEAETIVRADLPPAEAEANVGHLRDMLAQHDELKSERAPAPKAKKPKARAATPPTGAGT